MLDMIARNEGVKYGYKTAFGNVELRSLADHPRPSAAARRSFTQTDGKTNTSSAAGRYQFLTKTWDSTVKELKDRGVEITDFGPEAQDLAAIRLIEGRGALADVLKGDWKTAIDKLGGVWASLPSSPYKQPKRSWAYTLAALPGGEKYQPSVPTTAAVPVPGTDRAAAGTGTAAVPNLALTGAPPSAAVEPDPYGRLVGATSAAPNSVRSWQDAVTEIQQQVGEGDRRVNRFQDAALEQDANRVHQKAVANLLNRDYVPDVQFPQPLEDSINRYMARLL
jgi:muramidase (phage lysozyme)